MVERRKALMENPTNQGGLQDPSVNTLLFVGNIKEYLEKQLEQTRDFLEKKMQIAIETSQRERKIETERVDACRRDDIKAVETAYQMQIKQADMLAAAVAENAETLREGMAKTAATLAANIASVTKSLDDRLKIVEERQLGFVGASKGRGDMWGYVVGAVGFVTAVVSLFIMLTH